MMMVYGLVALVILIVVIVVVLAVVLIMARGNSYREDRQTGDWQGQASSPLAPPTIYSTPASTATVLSCPNCGAALQADWNTCPQCGAPVDKPVGD